MTYGGLPPTEFDVIVIGGGVNGCGVARDAALRGLRVALFERNDLGFGASGNSTGFIHGGPRYLATDPKVTRDACLDSGVIQRIARHLVFRVPVLVPVPKRAGRLTLTLYDAFFDLYDRYQPLKRGKRHTRLTAAELRQVEPGLAGEFAGAVTFDEWGIDGVRLCVANALGAEERGAIVRTHVTVTEILREPGGPVRGVRYKDRISGEAGVVRARTVVNATGAWAPITAVLGGLAPEDAPVRPGKGTHVYFDRRLSSYAVLTQAIDGRQVFVLPWQNTTVIGTTDDDFYGDLDDVVATGDEVRYLMQAAARVFPSIVHARAIGTWSGVRPTLFAWGPGEDSLSRDHRVVDHARQGADGLYSMIGGKLSSYRLFAEEMTDVLARRLGADAPCQTSTLPLPGAEEPLDPALLARAGGIDPATASRLVYRHGSRALRIADRMVKNRTESEHVCTCELVTEAEVRFVVEHEHARTLADVSRRTRLGLGACGGMRCAARCAGVVAQLTDASALEAHRMAREFSTSSARRRLPALGPEQARQEALALAHLRAELGEGQR